MERKKNKGITLIALIITIVVLLILAVVAINAITGDGIIAHARNAQKDYIDATKREEDLLKYYEGVLDTQEIMPTVPELQEKYEFSYYTTLSKAIEDVNEETTANADSTKENAVAGIYKDENNNVTVVLLKDTEEANKLTISKNAIFNLGGNTLSFTTSTSGIVFDTSTTATINGMLKGSKIETQINETVTSDFILIDAEGENFNLIGGEYVNNINSSGAVILMKAELTNCFYMKKCKVLCSESANVKGVQIKADNANIENSVIEVNGKTTAQGVRVTKSTSPVNTQIKNSTVKVASNNGSCAAITNYGVMNIENTEINGSSENGGANGVISFKDAKMTITNTNIFSDAAYSDDSKAAVGINNFGEMKFYSGSVCGVHSGMQNLPGAKLYVYGGTFDGYGHGGIYFAQGENGEAYVENATLTSGEYRGKYDESKFSLAHGGSFYIGGDTGINNIKVYMDGCTIKSVKGTMGVLRGSDGETNNQLYISNSTIESGKKMRIDENQKLFVGKGTNITEANVSSVDRVEFTNEEYKR